MIIDPNRLTAAWSALAGGVFWGMFKFSTALLAGLPIGPADMIRAVANVAIGIGGGVLVAYFVAPALAPMIPFASLRDLHALGFGLGAGSWELAPFLYRLLRARAGRVAQEKAP